MPRTPSIRYFESRQASYTQYQGRQRLLAAGPKDEPDGPTYRQATVRFSQIMHADEVDCASDNAPSLPSSLDSITCSRREGKTRCTRSAGPHLLDRRVRKPRIGGTRFAPLSLA